MPLAASDPLAAAALCSIPKFTCVCARASEREKETVRAEKEGGGGREREKYLKQNKIARRADDI